MKKIFILPMSLVLLIGISIFVSAWAAETYVTMEKGWNLVYGFLTPDQLDGQLLEKQHIKAIYAFIPTTQKYAQLYPNREINAFSTIDDDEVSQMALWVYSDKAERTEYWLDNMPAQLNEINLYSGWNFVGITQNFAGKSINQIKGNCNILKAYAFEEGNWANLENNLDDTWMLGENSAQFHGIVIKVSANCKLGTSGDGINPPGLPGDNEDSASSSGVRETGYTVETTKCEDNDGNNKNTQGNVNYKSNSSLYTKTFTDWCDYTYWSSKIGVSNRVGVVQEGYCEGNSVFKILAIKCDEGYVCRNGACIQGDSSLPICSDSDGGKVISQKGKVSGDRSGGEDYCFDKSLNSGQGGSTSTCSGNNCFVYEFTCAQNEDSAAELIQCSQGCQDGACT